MAGSEDSTDPSSSHRREFLGLPRSLGLMLIACLVGYLAIFLVLGFCAQPMADDFSFSNKAVNAGFMRSQYEWYTGWTGRFSSSAIISALALNIDILKHYWVVPMSMLVASWLAFSLFVLRSRIGSFSRREALFGGLFLLTLYFSQLPSPAETCYWLTGAVTYQLGNILYVLMLCRLCDNGHAESPPPGGNIFISCTLTFILSGFNETVMLLNLITVSLALCWAWREKPHLVKGWSCILAVTVASAFMVIFAPGNSVRSRYFPSSHQLTLSLVNAVHLACGLVLTWAQSLTLITASLLWISFTGKHFRSLPDRRMSSIPLWIVLPLWIALIAALCFPAFWSLGYAPPPRTLSVAYLVFVLGWFPLLTLFWLKAVRIPLVLPPAFVTSLALLCAGSLFFLGNGAAARDDMTCALRYKHDLQERYALIREAKLHNEGDVKVPIIPRLPQTICAADISESRTDWQNCSYAEFFGVKSIRVVPR